MDLGSAIERRCRTLGFENSLLRTRWDLGLRNWHAVNRFFRDARPEYVFMAAAHDAQPADALRDNLLMATHVIDAAWRSGTGELLLLECGAIDPANAWYAFAKLAGLKMCQSYCAQYGFDAITALPTNLYGPGDNFELRDVSSWTRANSQDRLRSGNRCEHRNTVRQGYVAPRIPVCGRCGRCLCVPHARDCDQRRLRRRPPDSRPGDGDSGRRRLPGPVQVRNKRSRRDTAEPCRCIETQIAGLAGAD